MLLEAGRHSLDRGLVRADIGDEHAWLVLNQYFHDLDHVRCRIDGQSPADSLLHGRQHLLVVGKDDNPEALGKAFLADHGRFRRGLARLRLMPWGGLDGPGRGARRRFDRVWFSRRRSGRLRFRLGRLRWRGFARRLDGDGDGFFQSVGWAGLGQEPKHLAVIDRAFDGIELGVARQQNANGSG